MNDDAEPDESLEPPLLDLASVGLPRTPFAAGQALPSWASFTADQQTLVVTVPQGASWQRIEAALAYGLFHVRERGEQRARALALVLPAGRDEGMDGVAATRIRAAWLTNQITVYSHDDHAIVELPRLTKEEALEALRGDPIEISQTLGKLRDHAPVESLTRWVFSRPELDIAHRRDYLAWHCGGRQVLQIRPGKHKTVVVAGSNAGIALGHEPLTVQLEGRLSDEDLNAIKVCVLEAVVDRLVAIEAPPRDDGHAEHRLQGALAAAANRLGWADDIGLRREFPVVRPGGGRGFIDLLRLDHDHVLHIIETKLGHDEMLVLQGLDYWMWATVNREALAHVFDQSIARVVVDFVVGKKDGAAPAPGDKLLSPYAEAHLPLLDESIARHVFTVEGWAPKATAVRLMPTESVAG